MRLPMTEPLRRPRRVLLTADTVGGVWVYALELARGLARRGLEVCLAAMGGQVRRDQWQPLLATPRVELHTSTYRLEWMTDPWRDVDAAGEWLLGLEAATAPDVIHLNQFSFGALPWRAPVLVAGHSCVRSWWRAVHGAPPPASWDVYSERVRRGLAAADLVVAPSRTMLGSLEAEYGPLARTRVVPNGRDPFRRQPGGKHPLILAAGRLWDEAKNVGLLDRVAPDLPWPVYVAGEARHPDGSVAQVPTLRALGSLPGAAVRTWLGRASIYAHPARYEPFGLSVLEAALAGCALVLGDIPSLRELWDPAALFAPPDDPDAWRAALSGLIGREDLRRRLGASARQRALAFGVDRFIGGYLHAYAAAAAGRRTPEVVCVS